MVFGQTAGVSRQPAVTVKAVAWFSPRKTPAPGTASGAFAAGPYHGPKVVNILMGVLKRRNRIVSFRVSQQEYEALRCTCIDQRARSYPDFTRSVACAS